MQEIRLTKLQPAAFHDGLFCAMEYASLRDINRTPYEALSYCWGDLAGTRQINILCLTEAEPESKHVVAITSSLHDALKHIQ